MGQCEREDMQSIASDHCISWNFHLSLLAWDEDKSWKLLIARRNTSFIKCPQDNKILWYRKFYLYHLYLCVVSEFG